MKIGVIGAGTISEIYFTNMIQRFQNLDVKAIADINLDGAKQFWLTDPDGNCIELMQYLPDSKQLQELNNSLLVHN